MGKGRVQKEKLTLPEPRKCALAAWITVRGPEPGPFFTNRDRARKAGGSRWRLTGTGLHSVQRLGKRAGLAVWPHALRHASITGALDVMNRDVRAVQRFSRHRNLSTVMTHDDNRRDLGGDVARRVAEAL